MIVACEPSRSDRVSHPANGKACACRRILDGGVGRTANRGTGGPFSTIGSELDGRAL